MSRKKQKLAIDYLFEDGTEWYWSGVVGLVYFLIQWRLIPESVVGYGMSDELVRLAPKLGVVSSPGYPLYTMLLNAWVGLWRNVPAALAAHLFSALLAGLALQFVFMGLWRMYGVWKKADRRKFGLISEEFERWFLATTASSVLFGVGVWVRYSHVAEIQALSWLLMAVFLWLGIEVWRQKNPRVGWWVAWLVVWGLGLSHEWWFGGLLPVLAWTGYEKSMHKRIEDLAVVVGAGILGGLIPFVAMKIWFNQDVWLGYGFGQEWGELWAFVMRKYVGGELARSNDLGYLLNSLNLNVVLVGMYRLLRLSAQSVQLWVVVPLFFWAINTYEGTKPKNWWVWFGSVLPVLAMMASVFYIPKEDYLSGGLVAASSAVLVLLPWMVWIGWWEMIRRVGPSLSVLVKDKGASKWLVTLMFVFSALSVRQVLRMEKMTVINQTMNGVAEDVLKNVTENGVVFCFRDNLCRALAAEIESRGREEKTALIPVNRLGQGINSGASDLMRFEYQSPGELVFEIVSRTIGERPIYLVEIPNEYFTILGINSGLANYLPLGYVGQLTVGLPNNLGIEDDYEVSEKLLEAELARWDGEWLKIQGDLARIHATNAALFMRAGERLVANTEMNLASSMLFEVVGEDIEQVYAGRESIERQAVRENYSAGYTPNSVEEVVEEAERLIEQDRLAIASELLRGAVMRNVEDATTRVKWADALSQLGSLQASRAAVVELEHALEIDQENEQAKELIEVIDSAIEHNAKASRANDGGGFESLEEDGLDLN